MFIQSLSKRAASNINLKNPLYLFPFRMVRYKNFRSNNVLTTSRATVMLIACFCTLTTSTQMQSLENPQCHLPLVIVMQM